MSKQREPVTFDRILVRLPNWLGDVVMSTPGLRGLRARYPNAKIVGHLPEALVPLLEGADLFDELWPLTSRAGGLPGWRSDIQRIAKESFDLGLLIPESISSALLMRMGRVRRVAGFARDPIRRLLLHEEVSSPREWGQRRWGSKERFVSTLVSAFGVEDRSTRLGLGVTSDEKARLSKALAAVGIEAEAFAQRPPVVIAPGASFGGAKCWPAQSYAQLADRFEARGLPVIILGAPGERERVAAVRRAMKSRAIVLDGSLDVGALKALLCGARGLVANDAGARHIAAAFSVPSVIFFGPTSVAKTADNLEAIQVLETNHECRPCYRRECPIDHRCLRSIDVDRADHASLQAFG